MWPAVKRAFNAAEFADYVATQMEITAWKPSLIVFHNTASPTFAEWHSVPGDSRMRGLEHYYQSSPADGGPADGPWSGGPHLIIADDSIWVFNPLTSPGTHSPSWNPISWGIEIVGNYDTEVLSAAVKENLISAAAILFNAAGLDPSVSLRLHHEDPQTKHTCPGKGIDKGLLIQWIKDRLAMGVLVC